MKKLFALLLAVVMLLAMTACGKDEEGTPTGESTGATTTNTTESTNDTTEGTQGTTEGTTGGDTTETPTTTPPTTTPSTTTPPTTTPPTTTPPTTTPTACSHSWKDATCTTAKTCSKCGATEGSAAGHSWVDATYTNPKTCSVCQATEGSALTRETEEITITVDNWDKYFEIKRKDIIPEKNAFGEYGTPEDMYYNLELVLKKEYSEKLVSIDVSIEFVRDTYLKSYDYDKATGIGTVTNEYKRDYNNTDTSLCNLKNSEKAYICSCHHAGMTEINGKVIYYAYICESLNCTRAAGTLVIQK